MSNIKSIVDYGADPTGKVDSTRAIKECIQAIKDESGGCLVIPSGEYITGAIQLCSNLTIEVCAGATLKFIADPKRYPLVTSRWEGADSIVHQACIYGTRVHNITIKGQGTIDGNGRYWWDNFKSKSLNNPRPYLISIEHSNNIKIQDIQLVNSPSWTVHPMESTRILIRNILVENPIDSPNTDGINPESCRDVRIENCIFNVGDDCIAIKSGTEDAIHKSPCEDIIITNCTMNHGHGGVVIGSEMSGDIRRVMITDCIFNDTDRGIRMKTRRGRGGKVSDITVDNILMTNTICPLVINSYYFCGPGGKYSVVADKEKQPINNQTPYYENITISNITARKTRACAAFIYGLPEAPIRNLRLTNIAIDLVKNHTLPAAEPAMIQGGQKMRAEKLFMVNTENTKITNMTVDGMNTQLFYTEKNNLNLEND